MVLNSLTIPQNVCLVPLLVIVNNRVKSLTVLLFKHSGILSVYLHIQRLYENQGYTDCLLSSSGTASELHNNTTPEISPFSFNIKDFQYTCKHIGQ